MTVRATGTFEVNLTVQSPDADAPATIGRMQLDKQFAGDLQAVSHGQMLATQAAVEGSAGYVAMELVGGKLHGRAGTFVLQHSGLMSRGAQQLVVTVVPDSGTGELAGLSGEMTIEIREGEHFYGFVYSLDEPAS